MRASRVSKQDKAKTTGIAVSSRKTKRQYSISDKTLGTKTKTTPHHPGVKKKHYSVPGITTGSNPTQPPKK